MQFQVPSSKFQVEKPDSRTAGKQKQFQVPSSKFQVEKPDRRSAGRQECRGKIGTVPIYLTAGMRES